jgi:hypothetical protein
MLACRRREPGGSFCRGGQPAWAERPGWPRASPGLRFPLARSFLLRDFLARVLHELHSLLHYWSFHLMLHALSHVHAPLLHLLHMSP